MRFIWHEPKRQVNLKKHGIDFADAEKVFTGSTFTFEDSRKNYGEQRWVTLGLLNIKVVVIVHTETKDEIRIISMREADKMNNFFSSETSDNSDEYYNINQADLDRAKFRVGLNSNPRKQSITISLDEDLIDYFKSRAGENGYQILINETLQQAKAREELENTNKF